jgi:hypothetical protein
MIGVQIHELLFFNTLSITKSIATIIDNVSQFKIFDAFFHVRLSDDVYVQPIIDKASIIFKQIIQYKLDIEIEYMKQQFELNEQLKTNVFDSTTSFNFSSSSSLQSLRIFVTSAQIHAAMICSRILSLWNKTLYSDQQLQLLYFKYHLLLNKHFLISCNYFDAVKYEKQFGLPSDLSLKQKHENMEKDW